MISTVFVYEVMEHFLSSRVAWASRWNHVSLLLEAREKYLHLCEDTVRELLVSEVKSNTLDVDAT